MDSIITNVGASISEGTFSLVAEMLSGVIFCDGSPAFC